MIYSVITTISRPPLYVGGTNLQYLYRETSDGGPTYDSVYNIHLTANTTPARASVEGGANTGYKTIQKKVKNILHKKRKNVERDKESSGYSERCFAFTFHIY